jgi:hypothetical protein
MALEGSGVGLEMGDAEGRDAEGLYEKGGYVGKTEDNMTEVVADASEAADVVESDGKEDSALEDAGGGTTAVLVVVLNVVERIGMPVDEEVARGAATVVVVVVSMVVIVVDTPGITTDAEADDGEPVRKDKVFDIDLWMIVDPTADDEAVTELAGGGTGMIRVGEDSGVENEAGLEDDESTNIVVVGEPGVPDNWEAVEEVTVDSITVVVVVVNVIDDAEMGSDAEKDWGGCGGQATVLETTIGTTGG